MDEIKERVKKVEDEIFEIAQEMRLIERFRKEDGTLPEEKEKKLEDLIKKNEEYVKKIEIIKNDKKLAIAKSSSNPPKKSISKKKITSSSKTTKDKFVEELKQIVETYNSLPDNVYSKQMKENIKKDVVKQFRNLTDDNILTLVNYLLGE